MRSSLRNKLVTGLVALVLIGGLAASTVRLQRFTFRPYLHDSLYLPSGAFITQLSLGYHNIVSDLAAS